MLLQDKNSTILIHGAYFWFDTKMIIKIEISIKRGFLLSWNPNNNNVSLRCALITQYSTHKNHTIKFYKGVWVYCIFSFYIPKIEGDMCTASWMFFSSFCDIY